MLDIGSIDIPKSAGIYLMKKNNKVIYVGKAKNLKNRILSYFNKNHEDYKTNELVKNLDDIEFILTNNELDALLLENNLIKKYTPKYNILLKDEKTYPYIKISNEDFPTVKIIRTTKALDLKSGDFFGPYPFGAWKLKNLITKLFKIRDCNRDMKKLSPRACLKYYMKSCTAPCINKDIKDEYSEDVENLKKLLKGNSSKLVEKIIKKMNLSSENMDFEKAIIYREQIKELKNIQNSDLVQYGRELDEDVFVFKKVLDKFFICTLNLREGKLLGKTSTKIELKDKIYDNIYESIFMSFYSKHIIPKTIILDSKYEEFFKTIIQAFEKNTFYFPKIKSRRKDLIDMSYKNLERDVEVFYNKKDTIEKGIKNLYYSLNLKRFPRKIECFDISNIQGKDAVASMSVSIEGRPAKKEYRKFKIQCKDTPDDFMMMREVIERRYSKLEKKDFPDVILIDGGLGQINSAGLVLETIGKANIADLLSLAKKDEEIYKYGESEPYKLSKDTEALKMFQRVRDEAHRFGITYHRKLRRKRIISSELDEIEGIGKVRKKSLLLKFGSVSAVKNASFEELSEIIPKKVAEKIKKLK